MRFTGWNRFRCQPDDWQHLSRLTVPLDAWLSETSTLSISICEQCQDAENGPRQAEGFNPLDLPTQLPTALEALYGHYEKTYALWVDAKLSVAPCFIVVCAAHSLAQRRTVGMRGP